MRRASASMGCIGAAAVPVPVGGQMSGSVRVTMRGRTPDFRDRASSSAEYTAMSNASMCGFSR